MKDGTCLEPAKSLKLLQMEILSRTNLGHLTDLMDKDRLFVIAIYFSGFCLFAVLGSVTRVSNMLGKCSIPEPQPHPDLFLRHGLTMQPKLGSQQSSCFATKY